MGKYIDLVGQHFGKLTVLSLNEEKTQATRKHTRMWNCQCDCGVMTIVTTDALRRGRSTQCKYCRYGDITGQKFGRLTVLERYIDENDKILWKCQCECGNIVIIPRKHLTATDGTKSCGCLQREHASKMNFTDLTGQKFGLLTVTGLSERRTAGGNCYWYCDCDCGTKHREVNGKKLVMGLTRSCGCIRSKGEQKIASILDENNIKFVREYALPNFSLSTTGGIPRFDFAILNNDDTVAYLLEFQGKQHYEPSGEMFSRDIVDEIKKRDEEKRVYCKKINMPLIYIKYTQYDNLKLSEIYFPELIH